MGNLLPLFPNASVAVPLTSSVGDDMLADLLELRQEEVALRPKLTLDSPEADYHAARRIELAGAAFFVLTSLPLDAPPASFIATTRTHLADRLAQLQLAAHSPYNGREHGHFDTIEELIVLLDRLLDLRVDSLSR